MIRKKEEKKEIENGDAGHRSRCLSHAKRALYRVSYIPALLIAISFLYLLKTEREKHNEINANNFSLRFDHDLVFFFSTIVFIFHRESKKKKRFRFVFTIIQMRLNDRLTIHCSCSIQVNCKILCNNPSICSISLFKRTIESICSITN